jgi:GT2 family glycosyltransferase
VTALGVVIVTYQSAAHIEACLRAIAAEGTSVRVVIVDNASSDDTIARARAVRPDVHVIRNDTNAGFSRANNQGLAAASELPFVVFLNPDTEVSPDALGRLLGAVGERPDAVAAGPLTLETDGTPQLSFGPDLRPWAEWNQRRRMKALRRRDPRAVDSLRRQASTAFEPDWLSASCLLARTAALRSVGGFDEGFFLYEEDADLCLRLRQAGGRLLFVPHARVTHHLGRSVASAPRAASLAYHRAHLRYYAKHNGLFATLMLRAHLLVRGLEHVASADPDRRRFGADVRRTALSAVR